MMSDFSVGQRVRVIAADGQTARRGTVALRSGGGECGNATFDVIFERSRDVVTNRSHDEEAMIPAARIVQLLPFESQSADESKISVDVDSLELKNRGNQLFAAKDYEAATEQYLLSLDRVVNGNGIEKRLTVGAPVLVVIRDSLDQPSGIISDVCYSSANDRISTVDVIFDDEDTDEALGVSIDSVIPLAADVPGRSLQRSLFLNLARCDLKRQRKGWAVQRSSSALAIAQLRDEGSTEVNMKAAADSFYVRAKALLAASRPRFAKKDCAKLAQLDRHRAASLEKEIHALQQKIMKSNRKLAKDIASWVDTAMRVNASGGTAGLESKEDLPVLPDDTAESKDFISPPPPPHAEDKVQPARNFGNSTSTGARK